MGCQPAKNVPASPASPESIDRSSAPAAEATADSGSATADSDLNIDIGDITYGVYANIEFVNSNVRPNILIERLSSPRFDQRTQSLKIDIRPPRPEAVPLVLVLGSTRYLPGHTVRMKIHVYRQYTNAQGEEVTEEIRTTEHILGEDRFVRASYYEEFDALAGLAEKPATLLVFAELEAWLFRFTDVNTFDSETADYESAEYKRYNGFNPVRINLLEPESPE